MKRLLLLSLFLIVFSATFVCGEDQEIRTWTSVPNSSGKVFKAEGYLKKISEDGKSVVLVINDKEKTVEIERLTQEDKEYIKEYRDKQIRKVQERIKNSQRSKQKKQQQSVLPQEGEKFVYFGNELQISRPCLGVYLGETIEGLAQRMPVSRTIYRNELAAEEFLECFDVYNSNNFVQAMQVFTSQGRILRILIIPSDRSEMNYIAINKELGEKYRRGDNPDVFYDDQVDGAKVTIITTFSKKNGFGLSYVHSQMNKINQEGISKFRAAQAGGQL